MILLLMTPGTPIETENAPEAGNNLLRLVSPEWIRDETEWQIATSIIVQRAHACSTAALGCRAYEIQGAT